MWNKGDEVYCPIVQNQWYSQHMLITDEIFSYIAEIWQILINYFSYNNSRLYVLLYVYLCLQVHVLLSVWFSNEYCIYSVGAMGLSTLIRKNVRWKTSWRVETVSLRI